MNISQLMHSLIGELHVSDARTLNLKVGQVVKGMVLQLLVNQEALVNINGIPVKAKLETPLNQGQMTMLQVQPESNNGQLVLKPLGSSQVQIANESLVDLLKDFGLKDRLPHRQLIQQMHQEGIPLNKQNLKDLQAMVVKIPGHIPSNQWIQTGILAFQRGLPLTEQTLNALHQVLFGKPVHQITSQLQEEVGKWLQANSSLSTSASSPYRWIVQLQDGLQQIQSSGSYVQTNLKPEQPLIINPTSANMSNAAQNQSISQRITNFIPLSSLPSSVNQVLSHPVEPAGRQAELVGRQEQITQQQSVINSQKSPEGEQSNAVDNLNRQDRLTLVRQLISNQRVNSNQPSNSIQSMNSNQPLNESQPSNVKITDAVQTAAHHVQSGGSSISNILKLLGIEHEQQLVKLIEKPELFNHRFSLEQRLMRGAADQMQDRTFLDLLRPAQPSPWDSIKSVLMQIQMADDLPAAMKENTQQLLQHITGQQLFITPDRSSHFSHLMLFLPLHDESGAQTAAVHIQSRKGKRGEIDAHNCRLLFDLNMKTLGDTLVDVQVVNKIVSLQVHNDHPMISDLLVSGREQIAEAFQHMGYQLSSMKSVPFPEKASAADDFNGAKSTQTSWYSRKPYKGVDIRI